MNFTWTDLNISTERILVECGLGNICDDTDPDYNDSINDIGVVMPTIYASNFNHVIAFMVETLDFDEPIPTRVVEFVDAYVNMTYGKTILYYDFENLSRLNYLLECALMDYSEELSLEPDEDNMNSFDYHSSVSAQIASTSNIMG